MSGGVSFHVGHADDGWDQVLLIVVPGTPAGTAPNLGPCPFLSCLGGL